MAHNCHGKSKKVTASVKRSRQKQKGHGKSKKVTAKAKRPRQEQKGHGKSKRATARAKRPRQKQKLCMSRDVTLYRAVGAEGRGHVSPYNFL